MMIKKYLLFVSILFILLLNSLVAPVNSLRVIYKKQDALKLSQQQIPASNSDTKKNVQAADIISAPLSCGTGEKLDMHNKCRKVNANIFTFYSLN